MAFHADDRALTFSRLNAVSKNRKRVDAKILLLALGLGLFHSGMAIWFLIDLVRAVS